MKTVYLDSHNLEYWKKHSSPNVMALGFFDGVHRGHQKVIRTAGNIAKEKKLQLAVMSFFPHPKTILSKDREAFHYLMPISMKAAILESLGVDTFYVVECNKDFLSLHPKQFVSNYLLDLNVVHAVAGYDFSYGHKASGSIDRLKRDSFHRIETTKVDKVDYHGKKISSTWIRELVCSGEMELLSKILGRNYEMEVFWNGECFQASPYYMIPAEGIYKAVVELNGYRFVTKASISANQTSIYVNMNYSFSINEKINIVWLQQLSSVQKHRAFI